MSDSRENTASEEPNFEPDSKKVANFPLNQRMSPENSNCATIPSSSDKQITEELDMNSRALLSWCATVLPVVITLMIALVTSTVWITGTIHDTARENRLELKQDLQTTRQELRQDFQNFRQELRQDFQNFRQELRQDLQTTRQEIRQDLQAMHLEFRQDLQLNRQEIMHRMDRMEDKAENARKEAK